MSWDNDDMQNLIANAQRAEMIRQQNKQLEELKKQNRPQPVTRAEPQERTLKCPACAEWIKAEAKICKHCRTEVGEIFAEIFAKEKADAEARDLEIKRQAESAKRRIQKELDDEAAATAEREKVRQERIAEQDLAYRTAKAARKEKLKATLRSRKGKAVIALSVTSILIAVPAIAVLYQDAERDKELTRLNQIEVCNKFDAALSVLAAPRNSNSTPESSNSNLAVSLNKWKLENGSEKVVYQQLQEFSKLLRETPSKNFDRFSTTSEALKTLEMNEMITACNLNKRYIFIERNILDNIAEESGLEVPNQSEISSRCSDNPSTIITLQVKNSSGNWQNHTTFKKETDPNKSTNCDVREYGFRGYSELGLVNITKFRANSRIKFSTLNGSKFSVTDEPAKRLGSIYFCLDIYDFERQGTSFMPFWNMCQSQSD